MVDPVSCVVPESDDDPPSLPMESTMELVEIADYMRQPELLEHFKCQHIKENRQAHPRYGCGCYRLRW